MKLLTRRTPRPRRGWELDPICGHRRADAAAVVAVLVYRGVTTSEVETPAARLADRLRADVVLVGAAPGTVPGVEPARPVRVDVGPGGAPVPDVLVVPGGLGWRSRRRATRR